MDDGLAAAAPEVFDLASDVLEVDVVELCRTATSGDADLGSTRWAQPAVLTCGVAAFRVLAERGERVVAVCGHSVGEYAALVAAKVIDLADALRLLAIRGEATDRAAQRSPGAMAAVMRVDLATVLEICNQTGVSLAADNSEGQLVVSGPPDALDRAIEVAQERGAKCRKLDVAGAFHSPAMQSASEELNEAVQAVQLHEPAIDVWSSTIARSMSDPDEIRATLIQQLVSPVRWRETVAGLWERYGAAFVDVGPGRVVGALARRIAEGAEIRYASDLIEATS